jgi:DMSO reductase anchor subunit
VHPAYSVILFTTTTGAGYGLLSAMAYFAAGNLIPSDRWFGLSGFVLSLGMITAGLLASTFHLGHPERAWRAFSQWRSSWLSREGIASVVTYVPALIFAWGWVIEGDYAGPWRTFGIFAGAGAFVTVYCTSKIYSTLPTVRAWFNRYTLYGYIAFAAWTGMLWFNLLAQAFGVHRPEIGIAFAIAGTAVWIVKRKYWMTIDTAPTWVSPEAAVGLGHLGKVRLLAGPSTQETYVQREMGYQVARTHATRLRIIAFFAYFAVPMVLGLATMTLNRWIAVPAAFLAVVSGLAGTAIERWLVFAEAKHVSAVYYGAVDS